MALCPTLLPDSVFETLPCRFVFFLRLASLHTRFLFRGFLHAVASAFVLLAYYCTLVDVDIDAGKRRWSEVTELLEEDLLTQKEVEQMWSGLPKVANRVKAAGTAGSEEGTLINLEGFLEFDRQVGKRCLYFSGDKKSATIIVWKGSLRHQRSLMSSSWGDGRRPRVSCLPWICFSCVSRVRGDGAQTSTVSTLCSVGESRL